MVHTIVRHSSPYGITSGDIQIVFVVVVVFVVFIALQTTMFFYAYQSIVCWCICVYASNSYSCVCSMTRLASGGTMVDSSSAGILAH